MSNSLRFTKMRDQILDDLCCPCCKMSMIHNSSEMTCQNPNCQKKFPIVNGIPILICEESSLFSISDYFQGSTIDLPKKNPGFSFEKFLPNSSLNLNSFENYKLFAEELLKDTPKPIVLVVGGRVLGKGMEVFDKYPAIELINSDVAFGPQTQLICDAHDIVFTSCYFNGVIIQAVLEHVVDPQRCVQEIYRVLKEQGLVYAETPFIQQVHEGRYDFTRYTHLGHRRLFRWFTEIASGPTGGPGMALAWSIKYFMISFTNNKLLRRLLAGTARLFSFYLKYFDILLASQPGIFDAASGYYFMGRKNEIPISDRELIAHYRGAIK